MDFLRGLFAWPRNIIFNSNRAITYQIGQTLNMDRDINNVLTDFGEVRLRRFRAHLQDRRMRVHRVSPNYRNEDQEKLPDCLLPSTSPEENANSQSSAAIRKKSRCGKNQNELPRNEQAARRLVQSPHPEVSNSSFQPDTDQIDGNVTESLCYDMDHKQRGICLIFSHTFFISEHILKTRDTAPEEAEMLKTTFERNGFDVTICPDYTLKMIKKTLNELRNREFQDDDCICICVSTHGEAGILWSYDREYVTDLFEKKLSKIEKLNGKPKLVFIQACRGQKVDRGEEKTDNVSQGAQSNQTDSRKERKTDDSIDTDKYPSHADFLIVYSTPYGYISWRDWFFKSFCENFDAYCDEDDINEIIRKTARTMCSLQSRYPHDAERNGAKQVCPSYSTMTKQLFLKRTTSNNA